MSKLKLLADDAHDRVRPLTADELQLVSGGLGDIDITFEDTPIYSPATGRLVGIDNDGYENDA